MSLWTRIGAGIRSLLLRAADGLLLPKIESATRTTPLTHDFTNRPWCASTLWDPECDGTGRLTGLGACKLIVSDFVLLSLGDEHLRYRVLSLDFLRDPECWFATVELAPRCDREMSRDKQMLREQRSSWA